MVNWNERFLDLANYVSKWSKDKSVEVGVIIASEDNRVLSIGYNGFPTGCDDSKEERYEKPIKYMWTEHAERNAIYSAVRNGVNLNNSIMYLMWFPCADCARAIVQSGIRKLVCKEPDLNDKRWGESFAVSVQMFKECRVVVEYI